jgi:hypothetical protein
MLRHSGSQLDDEPATGVRHLHVVPLKQRFLQREVRLVRVEELGFNLGPLLLIGAQVLDDRDGGKTRPADLVGKRRHDITIGTRADTL